MSLPSIGETIEVCLPMESKTATVIELIPEHGRIACEVGGRVGEFKLWSGDYHLMCWRRA